MNRVKRIWRAIRGWRFWQYVTARRLVAGLLFVDVLLILREYGVDLRVLKEHLFDNVATDVLSVGLAVLVIDVLNEQRAVRNEKRMLIEQMGSPVPDAALEAVRLLRSRWWLVDGSVRGADLAHANLQGARLMVADLQGSILADANLQGAELMGAKLQGAAFFGANLQEANLWAAKLQEAYLELADLQGADLSLANLEGAGFSKGTTLPDGTKWTPDTDLSRFTDPKHPAYWRSPYPDSPAYRGEAGKTNRGRRSKSKGGQVSRG